MNLKDLMDNPKLIDKLYLNEKPRHWYPKDLNDPMCPSKDKHYEDMGNELDENPIQNPRARRG